jgi:outer membrane protein with beta-barrel domain
MRNFLLIVAIIGTPAAASAQIHREAASVSMGVDVGAAFTESQGADTVTGPAFLLRGGYEFHNGVTPELAIYYGHWSRNVLGTDISESALSVLPGLRWSILASAVRPWISLHIGYGRLTAGDTGLDGIGLNTGAGVDWFFTPRIGASLHVTWNKVVISSDSMGGNQQGEAWVDTGAGLALLW